MRIRTLFDNTEVSSVEADLLPEVGDAIKVITGDRDEVEGVIQKREWDFRYPREVAVFIYAETKKSAS